MILPAYAGYRAGITGVRDTDVFVSDEKTERFAAKPVNMKKILTIRRTFQNIFFRRRTF